MSILIRDMEMPKSCHECRFYIENIHDRGDDSLCRASGKEVKCGCPLVHMNDKIMLNDAMGNPVWLMVWASEPLRPIDVTMTYADLKAMYDLVQAYIPAEEGE